MQTVSSYFQSLKTQNFAYANLLNLFTCFLCDPRKLMWHFVTFSVCSIVLSMVKIFTRLRNVNAPYLNSIEKHQCYQYVKEVFLENPMFDFSPFHMFSNALYKLFPAIKQWVSYSFHQCQEGISCPRCLRLYTTSSGSLLYRIYGLFLF